VREIVDTARKTLDRCDFYSGVEPRREGDPATLIADSAKAKEVLGWAPQRGIDSMVGSAAAWHGSQTYTDTIIKKAMETIE
jgi:UDP-glucose 4-epimerase